MPCHASDLIGLVPLVCFTNTDLLPTYTSITHIRAEKVITRAIRRLAGFDRARVTNAVCFPFVRRTVSGWNRIPLGCSIRYVARGPSERVTLAGT